MTLMNKGVLYALLTAICWSTSGIFIKSINQSALVISGTTSLIGFIFIYGLNYKKIKINKKTMLVGLVQFMMGITFVIANKLTSVGNAIVLQYSSMIFILIFGCLERKKKPYLYQSIVIICALVGIILFFINEFSFDSMFGDFMAIVSGFFFGLQFYINSKAGTDTTSAYIAQYIISISVMIIFIVIKGINFNIRDFVLLGADGVFQTFFAALFFAKCIKLIPAFSANVICMSEIIFAPIWSLILFDERFTQTAFIGACVMIFALMLNVYMDYKIKTS